MQFVSYFEVIVVLGRVVLGAITLASQFSSFSVQAANLLVTVSFRNSFFTPIFYSHFLRLRYYQSPQTQAAFSYVSSQIDVLKSHPSCPEPVRRGLDTARDLVIRYSSSILQNQGPAPAAAAGGANRAGPAGPAAAR